MTLSQRARRLAIGAGLIAALGTAPAIVLAADHAVSIVGTKFEPAEVRIAVGDTVTWTITESNAELHSVTSGEPGFVGQGGTSFDSGVSLRDNGQTYSHTFETAGVYPYFCQVHPVDMLGQVIVLAPGQSAPAVEPPASEVEAAIPLERRLLAGGVLVITLVVCAAGAMLWRRMNPAPGPRP